MLVKRKNHSDVLPLCVEFNDAEELFCSELLFPREYDENFPKYLASAIQGILSNTNLVREWFDIMNNKDSDGSFFVDYSLHGLVVKAEEVALRLCYEDPWTEYVPLEESFVKECIFP